MKKLKFLVVLVVLLMLSGLLYWFELRPKAIKKECNDIAVQKAKEKNGSKEMYDVQYLICTREKQL